MSRLLLLLFCNLAVFRFCFCAGTIIIIVIKNPPTIKQALFSTSPTQQTSAHKEAKGQSREGTLDNNVSDREMKNEEIFKCHHCKLEDGAGLVSGRNVALERTSVDPTSDSK